MTAAELADKALDIAEHYKTLYVMGCFGAPMTPANKTRYCANHEYNRNPARVKMIEAASEDTFGFDCVCLIKGILWGWSGDKSRTYGGAGYAVNGVPDIGADTMIRACSEVSTDFSKIVKGAVVWLEGHIGVYIGGGLAVECTPKWANCVQVTAVANIGQKAGYNSRKWTKWGKLPYVSYTAAATPAPTPATPAPSTGGKTIGGMTEEELKALIRETVSAVLDEINPVYKDLADVPEYWRDAAAALLQTEAVNGGTSAAENATDLNLRKDTIKAAIIAVGYHDARERESTGE